MFRKAESQDIDAIHQLLLAEAAQGRFDLRLVDEPYRSGLRMMKLPKLGVALNGQGNLHQRLEPFIEIPVR